jgi:hypothetical protein
VSKVTAGPEVFLNVRVRPATNLSKLEEVLVITRKEERTPAVAETAPARAVDILSQRLPSVPDKPRESAAVGGGKTAGAPNQTAGSVPAPKAAPFAKSAKDGVPKSNEAPRTGDAMPGSKVPPVVKSAKEGAPAVDAASTPTPSSVKPAIAQKPAPPAVKVSEQVPNHASAAPKPKPEQQPVVTPVPPEDKPQ